MQDYGEMVRQLMMHAIPVGDVVPFIKKGLGPNPMNLTEGAGRVQAGGRQTETPLHQWLYERGVPAHKIGQTLELQRQHGLSDAMIKHERLVYEQGKAREQAMRDREQGVPSELRDAFMKASRLQPENQD
jgi:hypothetical protein